MKKRRIFLMLAMVMCMVSMVFLTTVFAAAGDAVLVKSDGTQIVCNNVNAAINEAKKNPGSRVVMYANRSVSQPVKLGDTVDFTLDLNGYTYKFTGTKKDGFVLSNGAKLTIADSSESHTGVFIATGVRGTKANSAIATDKHSSGIIVIDEHATVKGPIVLLGEGSELTVAGTVDATSLKEFAISGNGDESKDTKITIKETAAVKSDSNCPAIYHPQSGILTVEGGSIEGGIGIQMCAGDLIISGNPSIKANGVHAPENGESSGSIPDGAAISVVNRNYPGDTPSMTITGNPIVVAGEDIKAVDAYTWADNSHKEWADANQYVQISSGNFSTSVIPYVVQDKNSERYSLTQTVAPYSYGTLQETLERAEPGDKITLFRKVTIADGETVTIPEGVTVIVAENTTVTNHGSLIVNGDLVAEPNAGENPEEDNKRLNIQGTGTITPGQNGFVDVDTKTDTSTMHKITFDANGGTCDIDTLIVSKGIQISLPTLTRSGYVFQGWSDGEKVYQDSYTVGNTDVKLTAQWTYIPPTYTVAVPTADNGKLSVSPKYAIGGQNVTITVTPDEGYELDTLTVTDAKGNELELKDLGNGKYSFKMPYGKVSVNATFTETEPATDPVKDCDKDGSCPAAKFIDVDRNAWYHDGVHYCIAEGLMNGTGATTFEPLETTNRAMLVTILYRLEGEPAVGENQFNDVAADEWYTKAVSWAADNGIVKGYGDGTFGPEDIITREQMATILHRYAAYKGYDVTAKGDLSFTDADSVSDWAKDAMTWTVGAELINGVGDNKLEPEGNAQRAQIATILYRFCENIVK